MAKTKITRRRTIIDFIKYSLFERFLERLFEILQQTTDNKQFMSDKCPKCDYKKLKTWSELSDDEKMLIKAKYSEFTLAERKRHRFCVRCGFEEINKDSIFS